jgi:MFS transporter, YNFM family, putative membrane transport protein
MTETSRAVAASRIEAHGHSAGVLLRSTVIGLTAFLTVVDLFATQAILPSLARHYGVTPAAIGFAVNACTLGMAVSGLAVGYFSREIDRRKGILISLVLLSIPTALLASAPNIAVFTILRVAQGLCMASAFTLTLAYLGEHYSAADSASAFAAYITGNVASNLIGRLISAGVADHFGLAANFYFFATLNLLGAVLVYFTVEKTPPMKDTGGGMSSHFQAWIMHLKDPSLRASFAIGFCILFAFVGTFTYVNFVLAGPAFGLSPMQLGLACLVFLPSVATTPLADRIAAGFGPRPALIGGLLLAGLGLPLLLLPRLAAVAWS